MNKKVISIPAAAVVVLTAPNRQEAARLLGGPLGFARSMTWDVNRPEASKAALKSMLAEGGVVAVDMPPISPKAGIGLAAKTRREVARIAERHGFVPVLLSIDPQSEDLDEESPVRIEAGSSLCVELTPMPHDLTHIECGIDAIGDIHGCADELLDLLMELGHATRGPDGSTTLRRHPEGRRVALVGDLTDRGPRNLDVLRTARRLHDEFGAIVVLGNHDHKLMRWLSGANVRIAAGLQTTIDEMVLVDEQERASHAAWLASLQTHHLLDGGRLAIAHAGISKQHQGRHTKGAQSFALYGATTGELAEDGTPEALDWAQEYAGDACVVHGHVVVPEPRILNDVVNIDTGCVFGGSLTAFRWPEAEFVSVKARRIYHSPTGREITAA